MNGQPLTRDEIMGRKKKPGFEFAAPPVLPGDEGHPGMSAAMGIQPGAGMVDPMTFPSPSGGTVTVPMESLQTNPALRDTLTYGREPSGPSAQERVDAMPSGVKQTDNRSMYEQHATPEQIMGAKERQAKGTMTMDDALALGLRRSRYGDFGSVREEVEDTRMITGGYGRGASETSTRMRSRDLSPSEWLERKFNAPARQQITDAQAAEKEMAAGWVQSGDGNMFNKQSAEFRQGPQDPKAEVATMGPLGPAVRRNGFYGTWDPKLGDYGNWKAYTPGVDPNDISDPTSRNLAIVLGQTGVSSYEQLPEYGSEPPAPAGAGKPLDSATAEAFLMHTGGDKDAARKMAREQGYEI